MLVHSGLYTAINVASVALTSQLSAHIYYNDALSKRHVQGLGGPYGHNYVYHTKFRKKISELLYKFKGGGE